MGLDGDLYRFVLVLHILAAIVGFGAVSLNAVHGLEAGKRRGREGLAISESLYNVTANWAMWFIYAVPVLGILLILLSDDAWQFSDTWISLSFVLYIALVGLAHAVALPNVRRMLELMRELAAAPGPAAGAAPAGAAGGPPPQAVELEARGKKARALGGVLNLLWVAILFLMVFKPGA